MVCGLFHILFSAPDDSRLLGMALTTSAIANLLILFQLQDFEHTTISWIKNLPVATAKRYSLLTFVIAIFLIPEFVVLLKLSR